MASITLGVDVGTTSTKCLAVREDGEIVASAQHAYSLTHGPDGRAEQDAREFRGAVAETVRACAAQVEAAGETRGSIRALALSTQGDTLIPCDAAGEPLAPAMSWMDTRAQEQCRALIAEHGQTFWYRETGQTLGPYSSACKLRWLAENAPDVWRQMRRVCCVPDYLAAWLTGRFVTDMPSASWSPFLNPTTRDWSSAVIEAAAIEREWLPEAVESGTVIGELRPEVAAELCLTRRRGVTLVAGAFDQAAAAYGATAVTGGCGVLSCGTAWVLYAVSEKPPVDPEGRMPICCHTAASQWALVLPFPGGATYDWFRGTFAPGQRSGEGGGEPPICVPHLYGGLAPDFREGSHGTLTGLTMAHTYEDIRLAVMRGIACEARRNFEAAERIVGRIQHVYMVGGAARSEEWPPMLANLFRRIVFVAEQVETAALGAAALAAGDWMLPERKVSGGGVVPTRADIAREQALYERYLRCYEAMCAV